MSKLIESITRQKTTPKGGGVEIDLSPYGYEDEYMSAYQNYLGGGMLGSLENDCTIEDWQSSHDLLDLASRLKDYYEEQMEYAGFIDEFNKDTAGRAPSYPGL